MKCPNEAFRFPCQGGDLTATASFDAFGVASCYTVDAKSDQPFCYEGKGASYDLRLTLAGDWMIDLEKNEVAGGIAVTSKGMSHAFKRYFTNKELHGIWLYGLHTEDGMFFEATMSRFPEALPLMHNGSGYTVLKDTDNHFFLYAGTLPIGEVAVAVQSDLCDAGRAIVMGQSEKVRFTVSGGSRLRLYGAVNGEYLIEDGCVETTVVFPERGIVPVVAVALDENGRVIGADFFHPLVLKTVLKTGDFRVNGTYVEYLRSMLLRRIGQSMPEEEPRGELVYPFSMWIRNYIGQTLSSFGFDKEAYEYLNLLDELLVRDGYLKQSYSLLLLAGEDDMGCMGNDGMGYYLWGWGKLMNRYPQYRPQPRAVRRAVAWLRFHTRWNGLIQDGTEPVDLFTSDATEGCLYTQGIVIAGLRALCGAYRNQDALSEEEERLVAEMEQYAARLIDAIDFRFRDTPYFNEYSAARPMIDAERFGVFDPGMAGWMRGIWSNIPDNYLHAYSVLQPGTLFADPEVDVPGFEERIRETVAKVKAERTCDYDDRFVYVHFPRVDTYSQLGMVLDLLFLNEVEDAYRYLDAFLAYWGLTNLTYILPECVETYHIGNAKRKTDMKETLEEKCRTFPFLYPGSEGQPANGYFRAPGNLIHVGYLFWIYDVMLGISIKKNQLVFAPRLPKALLPLTLCNYHTPFGEVNVNAAEKDGTVTVTYTVHSDGEEHSVTVSNLEVGSITF